MSVCKVIDTSVMINVFDESGLDVDKFFRNYKSIITESVVEEYTRKYPRVIPDCVSVGNYDDFAKKLYNDTEYLFPNLGSGERSAFAIATKIVSMGGEAIILCDDQKAVKKLSSFCMNKDVINHYPGIDRIKWGSTKDVLLKMYGCGTITEKELKDTIVKLKL